MKKQYQIEKRLAVESFQKWAAENTTPLHLLFETAEMAELAKASLGDLLRTVGKMFIQSGGVSGSRTSKALSRTNTWSQTKPLAS